jgi:hypothetical protein
LGILESAIPLIHRAIETVIRTLKVTKIAARHPPEFLVDIGRIVIKESQ